jgi:hypothetical protein
VAVLLQRDLDSRVRWAAAVALGASHDHDLEPVLAAAAQIDPDPSVRAPPRSRARPSCRLAGPKLAAGFSVPPRLRLLTWTSPSALVPGRRGGADPRRARRPNDSPLVVDSNGHVAHDGGRSTPLFMAAQNLWFYGIFASYRDARLARGDLGWRYPVAHESLPELLAAPFNPRVLKRPWVWAGLPLMLGAAVAATLLISNATSSDPATTMRTLADPGGVKFFGQTYGKPAGIALAKPTTRAPSCPWAWARRRCFGTIQAGCMETPQVCGAGGPAWRSRRRTHLQLIGRRTARAARWPCVPHGDGSYLGYVTSAPTSPRPAWRSISGTTSRWPR